MATRMQQRRGTAAEWTAADPVLAAGEIGYETDTGKFKFGDGTNTWSNLEAFSDASAIIGAAPATLDTLSELAAAIDNNPDFYTTVTANTNGLAQLNIDIADLTVQLNAADSQVLSDANAATTLAVSQEAGLREAADEGLQDNIDSLTATVTSLSGTVSSGDTTLQGNIDAEESARIAADDALQANIDTESATRIADDSTLQDNIDAEETARISADDALSAALSSEITNRTAADSAHAALTTNVHGIADTSALATTTDVSDAQTAAQTYADGLAVNYDAAGSAAAAQTAAEGHSDGVVSTHAGVTTNVHGIADTADLAILSAASQTFDGDITIAGNFTVSGTTTTVSTQDLVVNDPMIYIGEGSTSNTADLGLVGSFDDGTYQHAGIVRDASDDIWKLFKGVTDEPSTTINFAQGSLDDLAVNNIEVAGVVFTDGTQTKVGVPSITPIAEKTAAYTLTSTDEKDTIIEVNSGSAVTLTIPEDATVNFPVGSTLDIIQTGAGQVTIAGAGSAVVNGTPGTKLRTQWSSVTLLKRAANSWLVFGDTAA